MHACLGKERVEACDFPYALPQTPNPYISPTIDVHRRRTPKPHWRTGGRKPLKDRGPDKEAR